MNDILDPTCPDFGTHKIFSGENQAFGDTLVADLESGLHVTATEVQESFGTMFTANAGRALTNACHDHAKIAGWWHDMEGNELTIDTPRFVVEKLCLVHSEVSETMEGHRKGLMDDKLPHRTRLEVELADAAIRIFDMAGGFGLDVAGAIAEKLVFNRTRADHQLANRRDVGGKAF